MSIRSIEKKVREDMERLHVQLNRELWRSTSCLEELATLFEERDQEIYCRYEVEYTPRPQKPPPRPQKPPPPKNEVRKDGEFPKEWKSPWRKFMEWVQKNKKGTSAFYE